MPCSREGRRDASGGCRVWRQTGDGSLWKNEYQGQTQRPGEGPADLGSKSLSFLFLRLMNEFCCIGSQLQHAGSSLCYTGSFCWLVLALRLWCACSVSQQAGLVAPQHVESKSPDRDWNCVPHIVRQNLNYWATRKIPTLFFKATDKLRKEKRHHHSILTLPCVTQVFEHKSSEIFSGANFTSFCERKEGGPSCLVN